MSKRLALVAGFALPMLVQPVSAQTAPAPMVAKMKALMASPAFAKAKTSLDSDWDRIVKDLVTLTEIPAPPFKEATRAKAYAAMLTEAGLTDVEIDAEGNASGIRKGTGGGAPLLLVQAHLDTVFPEGTDTHVKHEGDKLRAPGIGDDTTGLAVLLALVRALDRAGFKTKQDIVFAGNVGEEGPGDLRGTRYFFQKSKYKDRIKQFISIEPSRESVTTGGVGSKRYKVIFHGPGGHSYGNFGIVNPAYAMANAITAFSKMQVPATPKTTFNVGIVEGGTSVNSVPHDVAMTIDMRSESKAELDKEDAYLKSILQPAVDMENKARSTSRGSITYTLQQIGERPVGQTPEDSNIVRVATAAQNVVGVTPRYGAGSSDSNIPMSLGIPAVTLGSGFPTGGNHALDEWVQVEKAGTLRELQVDLATIITLANGQ
ncbi:M20/M25/M40 family metallo-hydrolase [Sphingomonas nostoxanthinifaciens]|uniref:M20/M25/M40 family metallo-hydrolase n=1 Tax=Sphingomonas nostoxanthinifaciens TaxID=2872652 RepID=UPI001CC1E293|nr:M20/M25/M40 family metallo-hydrolase [Sphingomonas nostoxanthinifaciens]UAK26175.1 M20/M25/M40 family metallo-hydrolase [Sphingomonas nostoxanthinifaciens]